MRKVIPVLLTIYLLFLGSGSAVAETRGMPAGGAGFSNAGEKTFVLGASSGWGLVDKRIGVVENAALRPHPVLALSSSADVLDYGFVSGADIDLILTFDEGRPELFRDLSGYYGVSAGASLGAAGAPWARSGAGAALFTGVIFASTGTAALGPAGPLTLYPGGEALFAAGRYVRDFTIEFWLSPQNMENGEQILAWTSSKPQAGGGFIFQRIYCNAVKNRLRWDFQDFFISPDGKRGINLSLNGTSPVVPGTWSHHLIRFDADTGLLEYLVNGTVEAVGYTTLSGREGGEVYTPLMGQEGSLVLGSRFRGLMDEFRIHRRFVASPDLNKYPLGGGRAESRSIDLGEGNSSVLRVEALGGRASVSGKSIRNEYTGDGSFRFRDEAALQFFIRAGDSPYDWTGADWRPFSPGQALPADIRGRFVQVGVDFYPSGDGESTPYLEELRIVYRSDDPPAPPSNLSAISRDGAVELFWKASPERDVEGYLVYYGTSQGEYFGEHSTLGKSPLDAGNHTSIRIEGLRNGTLYYFAVAAYDRKNPYHPGEFSREVTARPLQTVK